MRLSEEAFVALVDPGCPACGGKKLRIEAIVAQRVPIHQGEPYGPPSWAYKGEELVSGTYRIACASCQNEIFHDDACPRCASPGGVQRALETDTGPLPASCAGCGSELLTATAYVPASVLYEGRRAAKARAHASPEESGFHAVRVECNRCREAVATGAGCRVCS